MKKTLYLAYYCLLSLVVISQVVYTLYQSSFLVAHGRTQKQLRNQQQALTLQHQQLQTQLARQTSLASLSQNDALTEFELISKPLVVETSTTLAAIK